MTDEVEVDLVDTLSSLRRSEYKWKALTTIALIIGSVAYCWSPIAATYPPHWDGLFLITILIWILA